MSGILFTNFNSYKLGKYNICFDSISDTLKRIKFIDNNTFLLATNSKENFTFLKVELSGNVLMEYSFSISYVVLMDYIYIDGCIYAAFLSQLEEFDENISIYKINEDNAALMTIFTRTSYMHDMDYFYMFNKDNQLRMMIIRNTRLYLYTLENSKGIENDPFFVEDYENTIELAYLDGYKWIISGDYAFNIVDNKWEIYDRNLELVKSFDFENCHIEWLGTSVVNHHILAAAADCSTSDKGLLFIYNFDTQEIYTHTQKFGFYSIGIINNKIITSIVSAYSGIGGIMVFDTKAALKYAHIKDEEERDIKSLNTPIFYQALSIDELYNGKGLIVTEKNISVLDVDKNKYDIISSEPYNHACLSIDKKTLVTVCFETANGNVFDGAKLDTIIKIYDFTKKDNSNKEIIEFKPHIKL